MKKLSNLDMGTLSCELLKPKVKKDLATEVREKIDLNYDLIFGDETTFSVTINENFKNISAV